MPLRLGCPRQEWLCRPRLLSNNILELRQTPQTESELARPAIGGHLQSIASSNKRMGHIQMPLG